MTKVKDRMESAQAGTIYTRNEFTEESYYKDRANSYKNSRSDTRSDVETCMKAYRENGVIRNIIDLMSDFVCKGIKIVHPVAKQERMYRAWFKHIKGQEVSERFTNYLYRMGQVPVSMTYGKITTETETEWNSAYGEMTVDIPRESTRMVPLKYTFLNPVRLEIIAPDITEFTGHPFYAYRLNNNLFSQLDTIKSRFPDFDTNKILSKVPKKFMDAVKNSSSFVPISADSLDIYYYRKDDWCTWAEPMLSCIFKDLEMLEKMKLADLAALDGAISKVRVWKLGKIVESNISQSIIPSPEIFNKFREIMNSNVGGGVVDVFWTPDVELLETNEDYSCLGIDKYIPVYTAIYDGLGIPFGSANGGGSKSMNSDFIKMQTFVERLEYGRMKLVEFWEREIKKFQKALGFAKPAIITFDQINLGDDNTYKQLLLHMWDRDIVSIDTLLDNFKIFSEVEQLKIKREDKKRRKQLLPPKASPYHAPQTEHELRKIILQAGGVTPSEVGLELLEKKKGEVALVDKQAKRTALKSKAPINPEGRPTGVKDKVQRKNKSIPISSKAESFFNTFLWGNEAQAKINDIVSPYMLENVFKKKNLRGLTSSEIEDLETIKFILFSNMTPFTEVNNQTIAELIPNSIPNSDVLTVCKMLKASFMQQNKREPTMDEQRQIQSSSLAFVFDVKNENTLEDLSDINLV